MILICFCALALALSGCGDTNAEGTQIVATTEIAADIARAVAGPGADVETLVPAGASPHHFGASAKDRARLEEADLVVGWGAGLEAGLPLDDLDDPPVELAAGERDPHVWMDPTYVKGELPKLADALAQADPAGAGTYRRRAAAYGRRLQVLDGQIRRTLAPIPPDRRKIVSSHDALEHFVDRYDLDFVGAPFGLTPESEASAQTVASLIERVENEHVPAVFAEKTDDPEVMDQIADEAHVEVVDDLLVESFGGRVDSYEAMLRYDARRIAEALAR